MGRPSQTSLITENISISGRVRLRPHPNPPTRVSIRPARTYNQPTRVSLRVARAEPRPSRIRNRPQPADQDGTAFSNVAHHEKRFHVREGKAPPAPQPPNTRITPHGSDGASALPNPRPTDTRINPYGSDGASALPHSNPPTRITPHGSGGASALPNPEPTPESPTNRHAYHSAWLGWSSLVAHQFYVAGRVECL